MAKTNLLIEAQYFPTVGFFAQYLVFDQVYLDLFERFEKQSFRNRCQIATANKVLDLVIPVRKGKSRLISGEVKISDSENWAELHLRGIKSAYGKAPFFEHYFPEIETVFDGEKDGLLAFSKLGIEWAEKKLDLQPAQFISENMDGYFCRGHGQIHPKKSEVPLLSSIKEIGFPPYFQCFEQLGFQANLSVIDLLMNEGPMARAYLESLL